MAARLALRSIRRLPTVSIATMPVVPRYAIRCMGGHGHGHDVVDPPFHRLPLSNKPLHEEDELIWNDGVAPETALDFDAPHVSKVAGLLWWLGGFGFFFSIYMFAKSTDQPNKKISADRDLPESTKTTAVGNFGKY